MHRRIADQLRKRIVGGTYQDANLPPELNLTEEYGVSRHTVRIALQQLVAEGYIERRAGSGTKITSRARSGVWAIASLSDLLGDYTPDQYLTLSAGIAPANQFPSVAALFGVKRAGSLFHMLRVLTKSGLPYALSNIFTTMEYGLAVPEVEIGREALISLVQRYSNVQPARARQIASATAASIEASRQLGIPVGAALLVIHRTYFDASQRPIVHAEVQCRPDRYQQTIDFAHEAMDVPGYDSAKQN
jgi:GntR family transcriptional regulator